MYLSNLNIQFHNISIRILMFGFILLLSIFSNAQTFVLWNDGGIPASTSALTSIPGTFPGGTVIASNTGVGTDIKLGQEFNTPNLNGAIASEIFGSYGTLSNVSKSLTFTFSTPVIINSFSVHDIDMGGAWHDAFSFIGVTFTSVTTGGGVTANGVGTTFVPLSIASSTEFANWFTSTTSVTSFTIDYLVTGGVTHAYLGYSMEVSPGQQAIDIVGDTVVCLGDSLLLTAINDSIFSWATTTSPATILSLDSSLYVSPTTTTTYAVYGTSDTAFHTVYVDTLIQPIYLGNDTSICQGETVLLAPFSPNSSAYTWQDGSTNPTLLVNTGGVYWAQVSNQCNSESDSITIIVNPVPDINITTPDTLLDCINTLPINLNLGITPYPGYTYNWTNGLSLNDSIIQNPISTPIDSVTNYFITVTDSSGLCTDTDSIEVKSCCITPTITPINGICYGQGGTIIVSATALHNSLLTFEFRKNDFALTLLHSSTGLATDSLSNLVPGDYIVIIIDPIGCSYTHTITFTEPLPVVLNYISLDTQICINGNANIFASGSGIFNPISLIWDNGLVGNGPHNVYPTAATTTYNVFAQDANNCTSDTQNVVITLFPPIGIDSLKITRDTICQGDTTMLKIIASGGGTDLFYTWIDGSGTTIGITSDPQFIVTPLYDGEIFTVLVSDSCTTPTNQLSIQSNFSTILFPTYAISDTLLCIDDIVPPTIVNTTVNSTTITSAFWDFGDGTTYDNPFNTSFPHSYNNPGTYNIILTLTDIFGCTWDTVMENTQVHVFNRPVADFSWNPNPSNYLNSVITFNNLSTDNNYNEWTFFIESQITSNLVNPTITFPQNKPGQYKTTLKVTNIAQCIDEITKTVIIDDVFLFYIPNAFTPDGDGVNEIFKAITEGVDLSNYKMSIFDRWGELLFSTTDPKEGWNGQYKSEIAQNGVYIWKIEAKEAHSSIVHKKEGYVNLIR